LVEALLTGESQVPGGEGEAQVPIQGMGSGGPTAGPVGQLDQLVAEGLSHGPHRDIELHGAPFERAAGKVAHAHVTSFQSGTPLRAKTWRTASTAAISFGRRCIFPRKKRRGATRRSWKKCHVRSL